MSQLLPAAVAAAGAGGGAASVGAGAGAVVVSACGAAACGAIGGAASVGPQSAQAAKPSAKPQQSKAAPNFALGIRWEFMGKLLSYTAAASASGRPSPRVYRRPRRLGMAGAARR